MAGHAPHWMYMRAVTELGAALGFLSWKADYGPSLETLVGWHGNAIEVLGLYEQGRWPWQKNPWTRPHTYPECVREAGAYLLCFGKERGWARFGLGLPENARGCRSDNTPWTCISELLHVHKSTLKRWRKISPITEQYVYPNPWTNGF